jgi:hypothetical protein
VPIGFAWRAEVLDDEEPLLADLGQHSAGRVLCLVLARGAREQGGDGERANDTNVLELVERDELGPGGVASMGSVLVECPVCRRERFVSARTARRGAGRCTLCISGDGVIEAPTDEDRAFWLERFDDSELAEMAWFMFRHRPDREHIRCERERLLVLVYVSGR